MGNISEAKTASATQLVRDLHSVKSMLPDGPVEITSHGRTEFVVLSKERYDSLSALTDTDADRLDSKLRLVLSTIPSMVIITDRKLNIRRANRAWCNFTEINEDEVIGRNLRDVEDTTNLQYICVRAMNVLASGQEESFELSSTKRPGRLLSFTIRPWPQGVAIFSYDRTDEGAAAERLMRDMAFDEALFQVGGYAFGSLDRNGRVTFATKSLAELLGADAQSLNSIALETVLSPQSRTQFRELLHKSPLDKSVLPVEYLHAGKDFTSGEMSIVPYSSVHGQECFAFAIRTKGPSSD